MTSTAQQLALPLRRLPFDIYGINGRIPDARMTTVKRLTLLDGDLPDVDFMVGGNEIGQTAMGVMGRNILGALDTEYDLAHGVIRFVKPSDDCDKSTSMAYWAGDTPVSRIDLEPDERSLGTPPLRAIVTLNGRKVHALFDSGATTSVSRATAHDVGVKDADMEPADQAFGAGRGRSQTWSASFDSVTLGDETVLHNRLEVSDFALEDDDMLVGVDFFLSHHLYVSRKQHRMYVTYNGGPVFAQNHSARQAAPAADAASAPDTLTADAHARRGAASFSRDDLPAALADLDAACRLDPSNASFLATRAEIHTRMKHRALALADLDAALALQPELVEALLDRATLLANTHQLDRAAADLATLDKVLPPMSHDRMQLAWLYASANRPEASIAQWTTWMQAHPRDVRLSTAHGGRCWARMLTNRDLALARKDCDEALDDDPKSPSNLTDRGWLRLRLDQPAQALADLDRAVATPPKSAWAMYGRGLAKARLGDAAGASADFAAARAHDHDIDASVRDEGLPLAPDADSAIAAAAAATH